MRLDFPETALQNSSRLIYYVPKNGKEFVMPSDAFDLGKIDPAMAVKPANTENARWLLPFEEPLKLLGFYWFPADRVYNRLPLDRPETVTRFPDGKAKTVPASQCGAYLLSANTAGGQVRFRTDSSRFLLQGEVSAPCGMDNMPFTGSSGFDLYLKDEDGWHFYGVTRTVPTKPDFSVTVCEGLSRKMRDVLLHFPLYNGIKNIAVGLDADARTEAPTPFHDPRPIVFYGTSITQGGCASRPGMASSNILSRMLDREVLNLGFSGSGKGEPEIARMLADIENPALYIIDYLWNLSSCAELQATLPQLIDIIRDKHPDTPVLLVSPTPGKTMQSGFAVPDNLQEKQAGIMQDETARRNQAGDCRVFFFDAYHEAFGPDAMECIVDGWHLNDAGFLRFSKAVLPHIRRALGEN